MSHVRDYHAALARLADDPIGLTDKDFELFLEYGGKQQAALARKAFDAAVAPIVKRTPRPVGPSVTRAEVVKMLNTLIEDVATGVVDNLKEHVFPRLIHLEQRLAAVDGIAPPKAAEKPRVKYAGPWAITKRFDPGDGVTHLGQFWTCVETTSFGEPSKDTNAWKRVA